MDWTVNWTAVLQVVGAIGIGSSTLAWLAKSLTQHWLTKDVERFKESIKTENALALESAKATLQADAAKELESLKADLRVSAHQQEVRFARLQEHRMEVIADLYERLVATEAAFSSMMKPLQLVGEPDEATKQQAAAKAANEFITYYRGKRVFFSKAMCRRLDEIESRHHAAWVDFTVWRPEWVQADPSLSKQVFEARLKAWNTISSDVPALREVIEDSMRRLLGVEDEE